MKTAYEITVTQVIKKQKQAMMKNVTTCDFTVPVLQN